MEGERGGGGVLWCQIIIENSRDSVVEFCLKFVLYLKTSLKNRTEDFYKFEWRGR